MIFPPFKRTIPTINSGASADIAFLLLTFFLVASSLESPTGIYQKTPPEIEGILKKQIDIKQRNILFFTIDANNHIYLQNGEEILLKDIRPLCKTFISNPNNAEFLPEKIPTNIPGIGILPITTKHVISLKVDDKSKYQAYLSLLGELIAAYNELRSEATVTFFHIPFSHLTSEQQESIKTVYPLHISESKK